MGDSLTRKIIRSHMVKGAMVPGEDVFVRVDQTLTPLLAKDGKQITRDSWFIYKKEKKRRAVVDELIQYVEKHVKIQG